MFKSIGMPYFSCVGLPNMKMTLGERVKAALAGPPRRTQVGLAQACGIKPPSVNDWVTGKTKTIEGANLLNAAAFLGVSPKWLAEGIGPMREGLSSAEQSGEIDPVRIGLGMRLSSARRDKKLTQEEVADKFSLNKATVSAWETGRGVPDALTLRALAKLYDTSADALLWEDSLSPEAMQFAAEFDSLNETQKRTLKAMWMAYIRESATDGEVENKMQETKRFKYSRQTEVPGFDPAGQKREKEKKEQ